MLRQVVLLSILAGCANNPDLPLIDEVPLVGRPFDACADPEEDVRVECVLDGDTFDTLSCGDGGERFRMLGIDAPEIEHAPDPADCYGDEAASWLRDAIEGEDVSLSYDVECTGVYGRTLAYVWARGRLFDSLTRDRAVAEFETVWGVDDEPALLLNEVMLGLGIARQYPEENFGSVHYQRRFDSAAAKAEGSRVGLYSACASR